MPQPSSLVSWLRLDRTGVRLALSLALAAWLSFAVAALLHVDNAYWAAMPVWVLAQSSRGLVLERAAFRIIGTLIGAGAGFALVHVPFSPYAQIILLSAWIALNAGLTHVLRGMQGYGATLAGMTAAVVLIPSLWTPAGATGLAIARVECTLIGVIVSTLVLALLTPDSPLVEFYGQARAVSAQALTYAARVLREGSPTAHGEEERRILGLISKLDAATRLTAAGSLAAYRRIGEVERLIVGSLNTMAAAQAIRVQGIHCDKQRAQFARPLEEIAGHLHHARSVPITEKVRRVDPRDHAALARLRTAVWQILDADRALNSPQTPELAPSGANARQARLAPHREWPLAWRTGALSGLACLAATTFGLWQGWPPLQLAALGVCIFVMVLGSLPLPQLIAPKLLAGVVAGVSAAIVYRLAIQPAIESTGALLLSLVPFLLLGGLARANPKTGAASIDANMCFLLAAQAGMPATDDSGKIFGDALALLLSAGLLAGGFIALPRRPQRQAGEAVNVIRRDLLRIAESADRSDAAAWQARSTRQILRLTLHLGRAEEIGERWPEQLLATLNLGQAMLDLQELGMPGSVRRQLVAWLQQQMPTAETAQALLTLANACDSAQADAIRVLVKLMMPSADLLEFSRPRQKQGQAR